MTTVVMTGDGARGSWQMGVLFYLRSKGLEPKKYVGISSGSLVAALMSQIEPNAAASAVQKITHISSVFSFKWNFLFGAGFYSSRPLEKMLRELLEFHRLPKSRRVSGAVSFVDVEQGTLHYKDVNELSDEDIITSVLSSICIPGLIAPYQYPFADGGTMEINPVNYALSKGETSIAVIMGRPIEPAQFEKPKGLFKGLKIGYRALDLMMHSMCVDDLLSGAIARTGADIQLFEPLSYLSGTLEFSYSQELFSLGLKGTYKRTDVVKAMRSLS